MRFKILYIILAISLVANLSFASNVNINSTFNSYLSTYIPNSSIATANFTYFNYANHSYVLMGVNNSYVLLNTTQGVYSFVLNSSVISNVIQPTMIKLYYPNKTEINKITSGVSGFENYSEPSIASCLVNTGLNEYNFTIYNGGLSCETMPRCSEDLAATGGITGTVGEAIMTFSAQYNALNDSYNNVKELVNTLNTSDFSENIALIKSNISNINNLAQEMPKSALFPLPSDIPTSELENCIVGPGAPYYCVSTGLCDVPLTFNFSYINGIEGEINYFNSLPLSGSKLSTFAKQVSSSGESYVEPVIIKENTAEFNSILNKTQPSYNSTVNSTKLLLTKYYNKTLSSSLNNLVSEYTLFKKLGINQNLSKANDVIIDYLNDDKSNYANAISFYEPIYNRSLNTSYLILSKELNYKVPPKNLLSLAMQQKLLSLQFNKTLNKSSLDAINGSEVSFSDNASKYSNTISLPLFVKNFDRPFTNLFKGDTYSIAYYDNYSAYLAALLSFIIGVILVIIIYGLTYARFKSKHKINITKQVKYNWAIVFVVIILFLVVAYTSLTYYYAAEANSFLPFYGFKSSLAGSNTLYVVYNNNTNTTASSAEVSCANYIKKLTNYSISTEPMSYGKCSIDGSTHANCLSYLSYNGKSIIYLNSSAHNSITYKGMYGNILYVNGSSAENKCAIANLIR